MKKVILASIDKDEERVAVLEQGHLDEFYVERIREQRIVGNIYRGKVTNIVSGIEAAFVDIGLGKDGFLYVDDVISPTLAYDEFARDHSKGERQKLKKTGKHKIRDLLKVGQEVVVQIVKESISTKGARLTTHISIPGKYVVYMPYESLKGISKKIENSDERKKLKEFLASLKLTFQGGIIARTQTLYCTKDDFIRELKYIANLWRKLKKQSERLKAPALVYSDYDLVLRVTRDIFDATYDVMIIDSKEIFKKAMHFAKITSPKLRSKIKFYKGAIPVFEKHEIDKDIDKIYRRKVFLKGGGHLVFDETESLIAIDVNSGSAVKGQHLEDTVFKVNMKAAVEIARQLKLRDVGGIIVIDFIDMEKRENREKVFSALKDALRRDKAKTNVLNLSRIGLVEMTRQRMRRSLESMSHQNCPYCGGRGLVKSIQTVAINAMRELEAALKSGAKKSIEMHLHPEVTKYISEKSHDQLKKLSSRYRCKIKVKSSQKFHIEGLNIVVP